MSFDSSTCRDVLVVGGGLAGLSAATRLAEAGRRVTLLEGRGALGGRAQSFIHSRTGDELDTGQHVAMGCYHQMFALLERLGTRSLMRLQPSLSVELLSATRGSCALRCPELPPPLHLAAGLFSLALLSFAEKARCLRVVGDAKARWNDAALDRITVAEWLSSLGQSENAQHVLWTPLTLATLNASPHAAAASHLAVVIVKGLLASGQDSSIALAMTGLSGLHGDAARNFIEARGGEVALNQPVNELVIEGGRCTGAKLRDGGIIHAGELLIACPPWTLLTLLPEAWRARTPFSGLSEFRPSAIVSVHLWLDRPVLDTAFVGFLDTGVQWAFDRERTWGQAARGGHLLSLVVSGAAVLAGLPREEVLALCLADLHAVLPRSREARVLDFEVIKERAATWVPAPGLSRRRFGPSTPLPGLTVAGDWTDTGLPATMEGACSSGHAAAEHLLKKG